MTVCARDPGWFNQTETDRPGVCDTDADLGGTTVWHALQSIGAPNRVRPGPNRWANHTVG